MVGELGSESAEFRLLGLGRSPFVNRAHNLAEHYPHILLPPFPVVPVLSLLRRPHHCGLKRGAPRSRVPVLISNRLNRMCTISARRISPSTVRFLSIPLPGRISLMCGWYWRAPKAFLQSVVRLRPRTTCSVSWLATDRRSSRICGIAELRLVSRIPTERSPGSRFGFGFSPPGANTMKRVSEHSARMEIAFDPKGTPGSGRRPW